MIVKSHLTEGEQRLLWVEKGRDYKIEVWELHCLEVEIKIINKRREWKAVSRDVSGWVEVWNVSETT